MTVRSAHLCWAGFDLRSLFKLCRPEPKFCGGRKIAV